MIETLTRNRARAEYRPAALYRDRTANAKGGDRPRYDHAGSSRSLFVGDRVRCSTHVSAISGVVDTGGLESVRSVASVPTFTSYDSRPMLRDDRRSDVDLPR